MVTPPERPRRIVTHGCRGARLRDMAIFWDADERSQIEDGIARYPAESGHCAALCPYRVRDRAAQG